MGAARHFRRVLPWALSLAGLGLGCGGNVAPAEAPRSASPTPNAGPGPALLTWPFDQRPTEERRAERLAAMSREPGPQKWNWVPPGQKTRFGHAELLVPMPPAAVLAKVTDYAHYKDLAAHSKKFGSVRVIDKDPSGTSLYFRIPIMKGAIELWYIEKFAPAVHLEGDVHVVDGHMVRGNVDGVHIAFTVRPGTEDKTWLMCDLGMDLKVPAPEEALDEELRDAAGDTIVALTRTAPAP